jgi:DNA-binding GntR family transcriptional regulator
MEMKSEKKLLNREIIYNKLREDIVYCRLKPGIRLIEEELTKIFNISKTPLREALRQLNAEGFVEYLPNKGVRVTSLSVKEVYEIYSIRAVLEWYAAGLAAKLITPKDIRKLNFFQKQLEKHGGNKDFPGWLENNTRFHLYISGVGGNQNLFNTIRQFQRRVFRYGYLAISIPGHTENYISIHKKVIEALINKNSDGAEQFMKKHLMEVRDILADFLEKYPGF